MPADLYVNQRDSINQHLEREFQAGRMGPGGKPITTDSRKFYEYNHPFKAEKHYPYVYDGIRYIRKIANLHIFEFR